jgi:bifunctional enzyme CysN/CysC
VILPSHRRSRVRAIALHEERLQAAFAPLSVAINLEDDIDIGRGALFAHPRNVPHAVRSVEAMVVWMQPQPLRPGQVCLLKLGSSWVRASCADVEYRVDPDTLHRAAGRELGLNDIGRVGFTLFEERFIDPYARNRGTGAFIIVDPVTNATAGAGMIVDREADSARVGREDAAGRDLVPQAGNVPQSRRAAILGQQPVTVWLTGLSGAGKSTLAVELDKALAEAGRACSLLDGDNVRGGLNRDLGFGPDDRRENIRRIAEVARLMNDAGLVVIAAFISPYRADRTMARDIIGAERFLEIYVDATLAVCERRDPKGLYRKARRGEILDFTGISAPYEAPDAPAATVDTANRSIEQCAAALFEMVISRVTGDSSSKSQA